MGLAFVAFWLAIVLFLFPFAYTAISFFRERASRNAQLREIQEKLSAKQEPKD